MPEEARFGLMTRDEQREVRHAPLSDPIDASDALLQARGIPRKLETCHPARPRLQVQALPGHVGGQ